MAACLLGSGILAFERTGPSPDPPGAYHGIYVVHLDSRESWSISTPSSIFAGPVLSPNGAQIAFAGWPSEWSPGERGWRMFLVDVAGKKPLEVAGGGVPTWDPDGSQLYYWDTWDAGPGPCYRIPLYAPPARPGAPRLTHGGLTTSSPALYWDACPSVAPDDVVVFAATGGCFASEARGMYILSRGVMEPRLLKSAQRESDSTMTRSMAFESPVWSPNGDRLAFIGIVTVTDWVNSQETDSLVLFVADPSGGSDITVLRRPMDRRQGSLGIMASVAWSPDASKLVLNIPDGKFSSHLYVVNADGSGFHQITFADGVTDRSPSWSR